MEARSKWEKDEEGVENEKVFLRNEPPLYIMTKEGRQSEILEFEKARLNFVKRGVNGIRKDKTEKALNACHSGVTSQ